jgi:hypothetical protein
MDMKTYTYDETLAKLKEIVENKGEDFIYCGDPVTDSCYYVRDGEPDCGVGHVLVAFGVTPSLLEEGGQFGSAFAGALLVNLEYREIVSFDSRARSLLVAFQQAQDSRTPWGESLWGAIEYVSTGRYL